MASLETDGFVMADGDVVYMEDRRRLIERAVEVAERHRQLEPLLQRFRARVPGFGNWPTRERIQAAVRAWRHAIAKAEKHCKRLGTDRLLSDTGLAPALAAYAGHGSSVDDLSLPPAAAADQLEQAARHIAASTAELQDGGSLIVADVRRQVRQEHAEADEAGFNALHHLIEVWETTLRAALTDDDGRILVDCTSAEGCRSLAGAVVAFSSAMTRWGHPMDLDVVALSDDAGREAIRIYKWARAGDEGAIFEQLKLLASTDLAGPVWECLRHALPKQLLGLREPPPAPTGWEGPYVRDVASPTEFAEWLGACIKVIEVLGRERDVRALGRSVRNAYRLIDKLGLQGLPAQPLGLKDNHEEVAILRRLRATLLEAKAPMPTSVPATALSPLPGVPSTSRRFEGAELLVFEDHVKLGGVKICVGPRSARKRQLLTLLSEGSGSGEAVAYSGKELADRLSTTADAVAGLVRGLRKEITKACAPAGLGCKQGEVIVSGAQGYRLAETIAGRTKSQSVQGTGRKARSVTDARVTDQRVTRLCLKTGLFVGAG